MPKDPSRPRSRVARVLQITGAVLLAVVFVAIGGILIWSTITYPASEAGLAAARADDRIAIDDTADRVVLTPTDDSAPLDGEGLVFLAGAKVEPLAYVSTFRELAAEGVTVVIVRPILNFAIIDPRPLSDFTAAAPDVTTWSVGGHSAGGVRGCTYAEDPEVRRLVLLASYCSLGDLSDRTDLAALSITGSRDGVLNADAAAESRSLMPADTEYVELDGVNHAQFGDYGDQAGDDPATTTDDEARAEIADVLTAFFAGL